MLRSFDPGTPGAPLPRGGRRRTPSRFVASSVARRRSLVRPCGFPRDRRQSASKSVSTTDVSQHEHPSKHHLRRLSAERRGKTRRRSPSRSSSGPAFPRAPKKTPDHLAVIRPPTAARLTARCRLRVDRLPPVVLSRRGGKSAAALSAEQRLRRIEPSDASWGAAWRKGLPEQFLALPCRLSSFQPLARQCRQPFRARGAFHRKRPRERSCESPTWSAAPLAGGDSRRTLSSMFENID